MNNKKEKDKIIKSNNNVFGFNQVIASLESIAIIYYQKITILKIATVNTVCMTLLSL